MRGTTVEKNQTFTFLLWYEPRVHPEPADWRNTNCSISYNVFPHVFLFWLHRLPTGRLFRPPTQGSLPLHFPWYNHHVNPLPQQHFFHLHYFLCPSELLLSLEAGISFQQIKQFFFWFEDRDIHYMFCLKLCPLCPCTMTRRRVVSGN